MPEVPKASLSSGRVSPCRSLKELSQGRFSFWFKWATLKTTPSYVGFCAAKGDFVAIPYLVRRFDLAKS